MQNVKNQRRVNETDIDTSLTFVSLSASPSWAKVRTAQTHQADPGLPVARWLSSHVVSPKTG